MLDLSVKGFLEQLASDAPAPGGGSAAALSGSMAAALVTMVANLTQGREKFAAVEETMTAMNSEGTGLRLELSRLMEEDTAAFQQVMAALRLPKATAAEKAERSARLQGAMVKAAQVPLTTAETALKVLNLALTAAEKGNPAAASDVGVAALLARTAVEGAALNVKINLSSIKDATVKEELRERTEQAIRKPRTLEEKVLAQVESRL
ncbi:MAG: cyclodeaminase/cyclohydrolase family protein [bacterium]